MTLNAQNIAPLGNLTIRQSQVLCYYAWYARTYHRPPTYDEVAAWLGLRSKSNIGRIVTILIQNGLMEMTPHGAGLTRAGEVLIPKERAR